ncbi:hypothetical protein [Thalassoglobus sp.]|uniref:hypothetical protein n=1 Tax=Thalassoglobus sp. TaxID=2795869 RepID=UPI003AA9A0DC
MSLPRCLSPVLIVLAVAIVMSSESQAAKPQLKGNAESATIHGKTVEFKFDTLPEKSELRFPRLNARLKEVYWKGAPDKPLKLTPDTTEWVVKLTKPPAEKVVVAEFLDAPDIGDTSPVLTPSANDGTILLPAHFAQTRGEKLRFEPQPHKNTIGYWTKVDDWAFWQFEIESSGEFHLDIFQGCDTGQGGSEVEVRVVQDKKIVDSVTFTVEETGHFQNFKERRIGKLTIPQPGQYQFEIRPKKLANKAVMDVRKVLLIPIN